MFGTYVLAGVVAAVPVLDRAPPATDVSPDVVDAVDARVVRVATDGDAGSTVTDAGSGSQDGDI